MAEPVAAKGSRQKFDWPIQMPDIDWNSPKAEIRWLMAGGSGVYFYCPIESFLLCAATSTCEAEFRAKLYDAGRLEHYEHRDEQRAKAAASKGSTA